MISNNSSHLLLFLCSPYPLSFLFSPLIFTSCYFLPRFFLFFTITKRKRGNRRRKEKERVRGGEKIEEKEEQEASRCLQNTKIKQLNMYQKNKMPHLS